MENIQFRKTMKCLERNLGITAIHSIFKEIPTDQELAKSLHTAITKGNAKVMQERFARRTIFVAISASNAAA